MKKNKIDTSNVDFEALVRTLLKLDPAALASMDNETGKTAVGLQIFVRITVARAIGSVWAPEDAIFRLYSDQQARAAGWPDAATMNLSTIFAFALVRASRKARGLRDIPLYPVDIREAEAPRMRAPDKLLTASEYAAVATTLFKDDILAMRDAASFPAPSSTSYCALVREWLGIKPQYLVRPWYTTRCDADAAFAHNPDGAVSYGMASMLMSVLEAYQAAAAKKIDKISLMVVDDRNYEGRECAKRVNIGALLTGALLNEGTRDIGFFVLKVARRRARTLH